MTQELLACRGGLDSMGSVMMLSRVGGTREEVMGSSSDDWIY
jgi:hypothetical protein